MKLNKANIGHPCPRCKRPITEEVVASLHQGRIDKAKEAAKRLRETGKLLGRKRQRDDALILALKKQGKSYAEIAAEAKCSEMTVSRSLREFREKEQAFWRQNSKK